MNRIKLSFFLFIGVLSVVSGQDKIDKTMEKISSFEITNDSIIVSVRNSGYTGKESFVFDVNEDSQFYEVSLMRIKSDDGKMVPEIIELKYEYAEIIKNYDRRKPIRLMNMFSYFNLFW